MLLSDLLESPANDMLMSEQAHSATMTVIHAIYGGLAAQHHIDLGESGEFLVWGCDVLGLVKSFPELSEYCIMLGHKNPKTVGLSGAVYRFDSPLLNKYKRCVIKD